MTTENIAVSNDAIADLLEETAMLMGLVDENPFKIKAIEKAAAAIRSLDSAASELASAQTLHEVPGVGKSIAAYVDEIVQTGSFAQHRQLLNLVPPGIIELSAISGIGPKKLKTLWHNLHITSIDALESACRSGLITQTKGFGEKSAQQFLASIEQIRQQKGWLLLHQAQKAFQAIAVDCQLIHPQADIYPTGALLRNCPIITQLEVVVGTNDVLATIESLFAAYPSIQEVVSLAGESQYFSLYRETPIVFHICLKENTDLVVFRHSWAETSPIAQQLLDPTDKEQTITSFEDLGIPYRAPALRESEDSWFITQPEWTEAWDEQRLVQRNQLQGLLHLHTTFSDGMHSLSEMAQAAQTKGFAYMLVTDHSRTAVYANGLSIERLLHQFEEIAKLNQALFPFVILKGIESDILTDGNLDYPAEILQQLDAVIVSIHSGFKMDEVQATTRLIKAIENRYTTILGHSTGRLLLKRAGYTIHHQAVIDACAANQVAIELNCNPYRMDIDWRWIPYALSKGVKIAINPDAHSIDEIDYCNLGLAVAQKGALTAAQTLNCLSIADFKAFASKSQANS